MKSSEVLENIVKSIASFPEAVFVSQTTDEMGVLLTLDVHKEDMGKIIGRQGDTAKAIRTIIRICGVTENARVSLKINEPNK